MSTGETEKTCRSCGISKPLTAFYLQHGGKHGRRGTCCVCLRDKASRSESLSPGQALVYALIDPRTQEVRYIGVTTSPALRRANHSSVPAGTRETDAPTTKQEWVAALRRSGVKPLMRTLEAIPLEGARSAEKRWLDHYKAVSPGLLFNEAAPGSLGGASPCRITRNQDTLTISRQGDMGSNCTLRHAGRKGVGGFIEITATVEGKRRIWTIDARELVKFSTKRLTGDYT